ncbi:3'(2'),5'-bisphosphate nucleotidase CysQ [Frateuria aurantia]
MTAASTVDPRMEALAALARQAGERILEIYAQPFEVQQKADHSPVTAADLAAQAVIMAGLQQLDPEVPVVSEEAVNADWEQRRQWARYWLVDPLDGTREFVKRNGEFTVNIALVEDHQPVLGVVLAPVTGAIYLAGRGLGAWAQRSDAASWARLQCRPLAQPPTVAGSRSYEKARPVELEQIAGTEYISVAMGSSLKFCLIADGQADIYLRLGATSEWDTAAAQCVLEEAGGAVLDLHGRPLSYNRGPSLINPEFIAVGDVSTDWGGRLQQLRAARASMA